MINYSSPFISLQNICIQINQQSFFDSLNWTIYPNQHWAILGQTGSGKTLLAKTLSHNFSLLHGEILYYFDPENQPEGRPYLNRNEILTLSPEAQRDFLKPFSLYHQARWHSFEGEDAPTVSELLSAKSIEHRSPFETTRFVIDEDLYLQKRARVVDLFKLDYLLNRQIIHLSHGESRKVLIARLLMQSPRLLILDDPYSGLDTESRSLLSGGIQNLLQEGSPQILFITSKPEEIPSGIDHLLVMQDMKCIEQGERETILSRLGNLGTGASTKKDFNSETKLPPAFDEVVNLYSKSLQQNGFHRSGDIIRMKRISVNYSGTSILRDIDWEIKPSERWALRGHNGAGKSTLLSLILADNPQAYANDISIFGQKRGGGESIWEIKQNIGWVSPELHIFYPNEATCLEVVCSGFFDSVGLYRYCSKEQLKTAETWMQAFGIDQMNATPFFTLSAGQQRLVLLARALVKNPPLLILDEPCQGLDEIHRRIFISLLDRLCATTPVTLIYVTHYLDELPASITHQLVLDQGMTVTYGKIMAN